MGTLIELTSKVLEKMKAQADAEREAARLGSVGGSPNTLNIMEGDSKSYSIATIGIEQRI